MARTLCPDRERASIALVVALIILFSASSVSQIAAILLGGIAGLSLCRARTAGNDRTGYGAGLAHCGPGGARGVLSAARRPSRAAWPSKLAGVALFEAFYRSSALVFGGGHVVLPLLREAFVTPGWVSDDAFLAGYGAAQAVPGLLFTFAAYLGVVVNTSPHGLTGAALGLIGIFLPGVLILMGTLPFWESFRKRVGAQAVMRGVNAAVVGLLGAALYNPVWTSSVKTPRDFGIALVGFVLLTVWRAAPLVVVIVSALGGIALAEAM
jgi:chromate transporter